MVYVINHNFILSQFLKLTISLILCSFVLIIILNEEKLLWYIIIAIFDFFAKINCFWSGYTLVILLNENHFCRGKISRGLVWSWIIFISFNLLGNFRNILVSFNSIRDLIRIDRFIKLVIQVVAHFTLMTRKNIGLVDQFHINHW